MQKLDPRFSKLASIIIAFCATGISPTLAQAAAPSIRWVQQAGGTSRDYGTGIAVDLAGSSYVIGKSSSSNAVFGSFALTNAGLFIARHDTNGTAIWARQVVPDSSVWDHNIATDGSGNAYIAGSFRNSLDFGGTVLTNGTPVSFEVFLAKYDNLGNLAWARRAGATGTTNNMRAFALAIDSAGNSFITGSFYGTANFGTTNLDAGSVQGIFIAKYDTAGGLVWVRSFLAPDSGPDLPSGMALDALGNCYIAGYFYSPTLTFGAITLTNAGDQDLFVVKCDSDGFVLWAKRGGGSAQEKPAGLAVDSSGACYLAGSTTGTGSISFDACAVTNSAFFLVKYDLHGNVLWCKKSVEFNSSPFLQGSVHRSAVDAEGNSYLLGQFFGTATSDGITLTNRGGNWNDPNSYQSYIIVKFDKVGNSLWTKQFGGGSDDGQNFRDIKSGIAVDAAGNCSVTGFIAITNAAFDIFTISTTGDEDVFIARIDADLPRLSIVLDGSAAVLSWPTNQPAFQLESATILPAGTNWLMVTNPLSVIGNQYFYTNEIVGDAQFFRLRK